MPDPKNESDMDTDTIVAEQLTEQSKPDSSFTINAKFVSFQMGDASHFTFEDSTGKILDFAGCEDKDFEFAIEVEQDKQNETNQGWAANPDLKGKWFGLKYVYRMQPQYPDGPMAKVPIILEVIKIKN
ncbi:MAG: hypothetical protein ACKVQB_09020 [Bacteroidia bacterium]